jgi:hypothetical protein
LAIEHRKWSWLLPLVAIATFFRESIALLIVVFLITPLVFEKSSRNGYGRGHCWRSMRGHALSSLYYSRVIARCSPSGTTSGIY